MHRYSLEDRETEFQKTRSKQFPPVLDLLLTPDFPCAWEVPTQCLMEDSVAILESLNFLLPFSPTYAFSRELFTSHIHPSSPSSQPNYSMKTSLTFPGHMDSSPFLTSPWRFFNSFLSALGYIICSCSAHHVPEVRDCAEICSVPSNSSPRAGFDIYCVLS